MQNVKETIEYSLEILEAFGIEYMSAEDFRAAKHSQTPQNASRAEKFQRLIFELLLLNMTEFKINLRELQIQVKSYSLLRQFLLSCLQSMSCELLLVNSESGNVSFNFNNMRDLLLLAGWLMAVSDIFQKYEDVCVHQAMREIESITADENPEEEADNNSDGADFRKKRSIQIQSDKPDERLIQSYNKISSQFRHLQNLSSRAQNKLHQFQQRLSVPGGTQISMKEFLLMSNPELIEKKTKAMSSLSDKIDQIASKMRNQDIFWAWLESAVESDKKEYQNDRDYGFVDEVIDVLSEAQLKQIDAKQLQDISMQLTSHLYSLNDQITQFHNIWNQTQTDIHNHILSESEVELLKSQSDSIVEEIDSILPSIDNFYSQYTDNQGDSEQQKQYSFQCNAIQQNILQQQQQGNSNNNNKSKGMTNKQMEDMLQTLKQKQKTVSDKLQQNFDFILNTINPFVTCYPK